MRNDNDHQRGWRPPAPVALAVPETGAELLEWQTQLEQQLAAALEQEFTRGLYAIRSLALGRSLTPAAASAEWAQVVDAALARVHLPAGDPAVGRLRDELLALQLGDQAYETVATVDSLYRNLQLSTDGPDTYIAALQEALGLDSATATLTAAGALTRLKERVLEWARPAKTEGLNWRAQIRRGVRTGFTGMVGSLVMAKLSATGARTKRWVTKQDSSVRSSHAEADGQVVPLNAPFNVGGQMLMFPGDPRASLGETVNCRCAIVAGDAPG